MITGCVYRTRDDRSPGTAGVLRGTADRGASPLQIAHHILRGPTSTDQAAIDTLLAAASHAIHFGAKVELLTAALERLSADDRRSVDIATKIVSILGQTGRLVHAEAMVARRRRALTPADDARMSAALAAAYAQQADPAGVLRHCSAIPDKTLLPVLERRVLLTNEGFGLFLALRLDDAESVAHRAIEEGTLSSDHRTATSGAGLLCFCTLARGHGRDAAAMGLDVAKHWPGYGQFILELTLINEDRLADAEALFASALQPIAERGHLTVQLMLQAADVRAALLAGRLDDAEARREAALSLAEQADIPGPTAAARGVLGRVALHRGSIAAAKAALGPDQPAAGLGMDVFEWVTALILEAEGDPAAARRSLAAAWERLEPLRYVGTWPSIGPDLVRLHLAAGDRRNAADVTAAIETGAAGSDAPSATGAALRCRALVEHDPALICQALSIYETGPRILDTAKAREDAATLVERGEAIEQLRAALGVYETASATGDASRVRSDLRERGVRHGARGTRQRPTTGWQSLTPAEQRVVALVAEGHTTRQIGDRLHISGFTVDSHLRHVYQKLGIKSRVQLTTEAIHHGAVKR